MTSAERQMQLVRSRHEAMLSAPYLYEEINRRYAELFGRQEVCA